MEYKFKPFDKVLVRDRDSDKWKPSIYSYYSDSNSPHNHICVGCSSYVECIPYEGNEHLAGTTKHYISPFEPKDGDFITLKINGYIWICIFKKSYTGGYYTYACSNNEGGIGIDCLLPKGSDDVIKPASKEEVKNFLDIMHKKGKNWDAEKKKITDYRWKPELGEEYYCPTLYITHFKATQLINNKDSIDRELSNEGWAFKTKKECQVLCDKLNKAIIEVKVKNNNGILM